LQVDFEFLGKNSSVVQTNYFFNGTGKHESVHELGFDCSEAFHNYTIYWTSSSIE
jgi:beta-glucanase (GH16 family)